MGPTTLWLTGTGGAESITGADGTRTQTCMAAARSEPDASSATSPLAWPSACSGGSLTLGSQHAFSTASASLGGYGSREHGPWHIDGNPDMFGTDDSTTRAIPLGGLQAHGHASAVSVSAPGSETGLTLDAGPAKIEPFAGLRIDSLNRTTSSETGAGVFDETIGSGSVTSVRSSLGVRRPRPSSNSAASN